MSDVDCITGTKLIQCWYQVFWQVTGGTTIDVGAQLDGVIGSKSTVILNTGASLRGRAYAQKAVRQHLQHNKDNIKLIPVMA